MPTTAPDPRTPNVGPSQIPRGPLPGAAPALPPDACVNFNLIDGRVACLSVPIGITEADAAFILAVIQAHVTAVARRGH
ncbi:hypothetical protein Caci_6861 [Catenulispora acidiphila DSM 44928]|uniref:Uncharacterized protein n=1 Tax=Catenulispora acidiphila (strain DSM 44928 / JCM 14897 / NBRC 102108 / NRRL B-24433 / ID139908) TaxID=479433 RepID=C7Q3D6_CATAD|nr:hypothetical protein [Catenulispora acidiphila]ACU75701.1 hypothetical protein Caci_6861 [Catenulispora acidiphila DSM 44928]